MTVQLPQQAKDLLDAPSYVTVATINPDGGPQTSLLWAARDGDDILLSTIEGRQKARNLYRDPRVSVLIHDGSSPYTFVEVRGSVTMTHDGGPELINQLSLAYEGEPYTGDDGTDNVRIVVRLTPEHVVIR
jgi:PPOX class probable F420-dependent enzyme